MNSSNKVILYLSLVLSGPLFGCCSLTSADTFTNAEPSLASVLAQYFPGKKPIDVFRSSAAWAKRFEQLSSADRNRIAIAAVRELSLRTTNGDLITDALIDQEQPTSSDAPRKTAMHNLAGNDMLGVFLLRDMENLNLISDAGVIEPLINMLEFPGVKKDFGVRDASAQVLCQLTGHNWSELYQFSTGEKHRQFVQWWQAWWAKNKNRHPVYDSEVEEMIKARISAIELQLAKEVASYSELRSPELKPERIRFIHYSRVNLAGNSVDSFGSSQGRFRTTPDGDRRPATVDEYVYLCITAKFGTPPPMPYPEDTPARWQSLKQEVFREALPNTDIIITVVAASKDAEFMREVSNSLAKLKDGKP